jgi:hypothetical protein
VSPLYMKMSLLRVSGLEQSAQASSVWLPCSPSGSASKKKEPGDGRGHFSLRNRFGPERKWVLVRIHFGPDWWSAAPRTSAGSRSTHGFLFSRSRQSTAHHPNRGWLGWSFLIAQSRFCCSVNSHSTGDDESTAYHR